MARLCSVAAPDELVASADPSTEGHELVVVRGLADPVAVVRVGLA